MPPHDQRDEQPDDLEQLLDGSPYRALRRIGRGAMGEIVEADEVALRRRVVVKLIHPEIAQTPGFLDRFRLEAQALAALGPRSPHIVTVLNFGETRGGQPFLVMEYLPGRTLKDELSARQVLPVAEAVTFTMQLLEALEVAHEAGIVHRDVKPENIFLVDRPGSSGASSRAVKLLDFGIAKVLPGASDDGPQPIALPTAEGVMLGTPRFTSPEQARAQPVDARSDIYSVGAVLFAMVTGRDPFAHARGFAALLRAHALELPNAPSTFVPGLPPELDRVVLSALAKDPAARPPTARAFRAALAPLIRAPLGPAEDADTSARRPPEVAGPVVTALGTEVMPNSEFRGLARRSVPAVGAPVASREIAAPARPIAQSDLADDSTTLPVARAGHTRVVVAIFVLLLVLGAILFVVFRALPGVG